MGVERREQAIQAWSATNCRAGGVDEQVKAVCDLRSGSQGGISQGQGQQGCQWPSQSPRFWPTESPHPEAAQSSLSGAPPRVLASRMRNDSPAVTTTTAW